MAEAGKILHMPDRCPETQCLIILPVGQRSSNSEHRSPFDEHPVDLMPDYSQACRNFAMYVWRIRRWLDNQGPLLNCMSVRGDQCTQKSRKEGMVNGEYRISLGAARDPFEIIEALLGVGELVAETSIRFPPGEIPHCFQWLGISGSGIFRR